MLHGKGDAADKTAAPDGDHHLLNLRELFQDLQADGALAGNDQGVVEGMGKGIAVLRHQPFRFSGGVVIDAGDQNDLCAVAPGGLHFADGRPGRHTDDGFDAQLRGGPGDALGVIARRAGDDAAGRLLPGQGANFVVGAPQLESAGKLQILRLDVYVFPQPPGWVQRCLPGYALQRHPRVFQHFHRQHGNDLLVMTSSVRDRGCFYMEIIRPILSGYNTHLGVQRILGKPGRQNARTVS